MQTETRELCEIGTGDKELFSPSKCVGPDRDIRRNTVHVQTEAIGNKGGSNDPFKRQTGGAELSSAVSARRKQAVSKVAPLRRSMKRFPTTSLAPSEYPNTKQSLEDLNKRTKHTKSNEKLPPPQDSQSERFRPTLARQKTFNLKSSNAGAGWNSSVVGGAV